VILRAACVLSSPPAAQAPATPMTPSPPHEALTFFEGAWTIEERPAEQHLVETCAWLSAGRRHMVCRSTWRVATGPREGVSVFSYRAADSTYLYYGLRAGGAVEALEGKAVPGGFQFWTPGGAAPGRARTRVTMTRLGPQRFQFVAESALGDGPWTPEGTEHYVPAPRR
jgi:hypothetical protein